MRERFEALLRALDDGAADEVEHLGWATVVSTPSLPDVWDLNHLRVQDRGVPAAVALAEAERRGLPKVLWETAPEGRVPRGRVEREVAMVHDQSREAADGAEPEVVQLRPRERDALILAVLRDDPERAHLAEPMLAANRRWHRAVETVALGARAPDGSLAGHAWVFRHEGAAQIEDVNVLSAHRGRGLGTALVRAAIAHSRPGEPLLILADADDRPQRLYARLGFRPAWERAAAYLAPARSGDERGSRP